MTIDSKQILNVFLGNMVVKAKDLIVKLPGESSDTPYREGTFAILLYTKLMYFGVYILPTFKG